MKIIIIYIVVSNHCHVAVLALRQSDADSFAMELKRMYSQWFSSKYHEPKTLRGVDSKALWLDNEWYVRNALAYIPRNALDNQGTVHEYPWSGFNAMFSTADVLAGSKTVSSLTARETQSIMHTRDRLSDVPWLLDFHKHLVPSSFCDSDYLEQAFNHDQAFFLKTVGALNAAQMQEILEEAPYKMLPDSEFFKVLEDISLRWFGQDISALPIEKKLRILPYIWRTRKTTVPQLARAFGLNQDLVGSALKRP